MSINRRDLIIQSAAVTGAFAASSALTSFADHHPDPKGDDHYADQVTVGIDYFEKRAEQQLPLCQKLVEAIKARDLEASRQAYLFARPPYEEIETHALAFEDTDRDIDARPYVFGSGETDAEFRGFHRVEMLLFGEGDLEAAEPFAETLVQSIRTLQADLDKRENFNAALHFEGMIGLANEVSAKKISSEEETWSDQSLIIFRHNWLGIKSQYDPFATEVEKRDAKLAARVSESIDAALALMEPHFEPGSPVGTPYSEIGMSERRSICKASNAIRDNLIKASEILEI